MWISQLNLALQRLQRHHPPRLVLFAHVVRMPLQRKRVWTRRVIEREHAFVSDRPARLIVCSKSSSVSPGKPTIIRSSGRSPEPFAKRRRRAPGSSHAYTGGAWFRAHASSRIAPEVEVLADLRKIAHRLDEPLGHMARMRACEPHTVDPRHLVHCRKERRKVARGIVRRLVVVHNLAEQLNLAMPSAAACSPPS